MKWIIIGSGLLLAVEAAVNQDPFYQAPGNLSDYKPGDIIRSRTSPEPIQGGLTNVTTSYELLYRTNDALNNAQATVTTVIIPNGADFTKLMTYQVAEDSAYYKCAPSISLFEVDGGDSEIQPFLDSHWIVSVPDYEGPNSAFTAGIQAGHATLDSIRAVLKSEDVTGVHNDARVVLSGYSGGALASGWAAQLQPSYAPDLKIAGAAFGGFPVNITATALITDGTLGAGLIPAGMLGLGAAYPTVNETIYANLQPNNRSEFLKATHQCLSQDIIEFALKNIFSYFVDGERLLYLPQIQKVLNENTLGGSAPQIPLYVFQGIDDEVAPVVNVDKTISEYCEEHAPSIEYIKYPGEGHLGAETAGSAAAFEWLQGIMSGSSAHSGCVTYTTTAPASRVATANATRTVTGSASQSSSHSPSGSARASRSHNVSANTTRSSIAVVGGSTKLQANLFLGALAAVASVMEFI